MDYPLRPGERIDDLIRDGLKIIQNPEGFCFSLDAVLLAAFTTIKRGDLVVDLGTGTGVLPLLLTTWGEPKKIIGLDIQSQVVEMARRSVALNNLQDMIDIREGDIKQAAEVLGRGQYDVVVSNPPYLPPGIGKVNPRPAVALSRHEIACSLSDVIMAAAGLLNSHGRLYLVHRPQRLADIICTMRQYRIEPKRMRLVFPRRDKQPNMVLIEGLKGGKVDMEIEKPLVVYEETGEYTREIKKIYWPGCS